MIENQMLGETISMQQAHDFDVVQPLLYTMYNEFQGLSKKKPQDVISRGKVRVVNRVLVAALLLLEAEPTRQFLDPLDDDELPQNSDVALMLGQTLAAMRQFRSRYYGENGWCIRENDTGFR